MKTVITVLATFLCLCTYASDIESDQLMNSRESQLLEYKQLQDSLITNKLAKYTLLNEKLLLITSLDSSIISLTMNEVSVLKDSVNQLNKNLSVVRADINRLQERTVNDLRMILILKVASAIFIVTILVLIYFLVSKKSKQIAPPAVEVGQSELQRTNEELQRDIDRLKSKEHYLVEEHLERLNSQKELYDTLSQKYHTLEVEYNQFRQTSSEPVNSNSSDMVAAETRDENQKLKDQVNSLKVQLDDSRAKNQAILRKIDKLISDLSGVNSVS